MKLEFLDEISETDITLDLGLKFKDYVPKTTHSFAKIKWNLVVEAKSWGLEAFNFQLSLLEIPIVVDLFENNKKIAFEKLTLQIKPSDKNRNFNCNIYKDVVENNKWKEIQLLSVPVHFFVLEELCKRKTINVKRIDINIKSEKKITLTI